MSDNEDKPDPIKDFLVAVGGSLEKFREERTNGKMDYIVMVHPFGIDTIDCVGLASSCEDIAVLAATLRRQADLLEARDGKVYHAGVEDVVEEEAETGTLKVRIDPSMGRFDPDDHEPRSLDDAPADEKAKVREQLLGCKEIVMSPEVAAQMKKAGISPDDVYAMMLKATGAAN